MIKIVRFHKPMALIKAVFGLDLINAAIPNPDITIVNSAKNSPNNIAAGILLWAPQAKVVAEITTIKPNIAKNEGKNKI